MEAVKSSLLLAVMAVEGLKGRARVQLEARFKLNKNKRICVIDADTYIGESIARIFTGFVVKEFGEKAFKVKRIVSSTEAGSSNEDHETSPVGSQCHAETL